MTDELDGMPDFTPPATLNLAREHQKYLMPDGTEVPGVTSIIKVLGLSAPALINWAFACGRDGIDHKQVSEDARHTGTIAHWLIECWFENRPFTLDGLPEHLLPAAQWARDSFVAAWQYRTDDVRTETQLVSVQHGYGGTIDILRPCDNGLELIDIKTSSGIYVDAWLQVAGYGALVVECLGVPVVKYTIMRPCKEPMAGYKCEVKSLDAGEIGPYRDAFFACIPVYRAIQALPKSARGTKSGGKAKGKGRNNHEQQQ